MNIQDPIADMLTRIRNACSAGLREVEMPASKMKNAIAAVLKEEGFVADVSVSEDTHPTLSVKLKYHYREPVIEGLTRVSKPSCRVYCGHGEIPRVRNGLGIVVLSTPSGVISDRKARELKVGGEVLCYVW